MNRQDWDALTVIQWLMREGRHLPDMNDLIGALGVQLLECGAPVCRLRMSVRTLHPLLRGISGTWEKTATEVPVVETRHGFEQNQSYIGSPIEILTTTGGPYRRNLETPLKPGEPGMLQELIDRGVTDYFGRLLHFASGAPAIFIVSSDQTGGFSDDDLDKINLIAGALTPIIEVYQARQVALAVTEAYLGPRTGRRVLEGQITRGDIETIDAAILISDLRGWTRINQQMAPEQAVALANRYFDTVVAAVEAHDGEILKFLGDGVLAIFPDEAAVACKNALAAARAAQSEAGDLAFGVGLHFGQVLYGNVGSAARIDFTVLGQAVNLASRIEGLCGELGEPLRSWRLRRRQTTARERAGSALLK